ncbi:MAG: hypothetical protein ACI97X_001059, partial [Oceanospirillaceae bacterium]
MLVLLLFHASRYPSSMPKRKPDELLFIGLL